MPVQQEAQNQPPATKEYRFSIEVHNVSATIWATIEATSEDEALEKLKNETNLEDSISFRHGNIDGQIHTNIELSEPRRILNGMVFNDYTINSEGEF